MKDAILDRIQNQVLQTRNPRDRDAYLVTILGEVLEEQAAQTQLLGEIANALAALVEAKQA